MLRKVLPNVVDLGCVVTGTPTRRCRVPSR
jgi:hypothetical protein